MNDWFSNVNYNNNDAYFRLVCTKVTARTIRNMSGCGKTHNTLQHGVQRSSIPFVIIINATLLLLLLLLITIIVTIIISKLQIRSKVD